MTLIVALEAKDCFVMAADSITTLSGRVVGCDTQKVHQLSAMSIAATAGRSHLSGRYWSQILAGFLGRWTGPSPAQTAADLHPFLDAEIAQVPRVHGNCGGGNTILVAGPDPINGGFDVWSIDRVGDRRYFVPPVPGQPNVPPARVWWLGDTQHLLAHIVQTAANYVAGMSEAQAIAFAARAIADGTAIVRGLGITTIGGDHIYLAVATQAGVFFSRRPSGVPCP